MGFGIKSVRDTVTATADKLAATARDTQSAIYGVALVAGLALVVAGIALIVALRGRKAATA